jgi:four helix bundle protein
LVREAKYAESDSDYIHKLSIAQKETNETLYWLELLEKTNYLTEKQTSLIHNEGVEILKLLTSIIITKKKNSGLL